MKNGFVKLPVTVLAIMVVLVLFSGCFSSPAPAGERQYATVTFINSTGDAIYYLFISERTNEYWGDDWLGPNVIENDGSYSTRLLTGEYDVMAVDSSQSVSYTFWITVRDDGGTFRIEPSDRD
jgi:hypothetical protein